MKRLLTPIGWICLIVVGAALSVNVRTATPYLFADEAVYHAMTVSLAYQGDIEYQRSDLPLIYRDYPSGPRGIVLKETTGGRIVYAKPFLYSLVAAPFYRLLKLNGFILLNGLVWWSILFFLYRVWGASTEALFFALAALLLTAFAPYTVWIHPEIFTAGLVAAGLFLWRLSLPEPPGGEVSPSPAGDSKKRLGLLSGLAWGAAVVMKPPVVILCLAPLISWIRRRRWRLLGWSAAGFCIAVVFVFALSVWWTGSVNPYAGHRKIFNDHYPLETSESTFDDQGNEWSVETAGFHLQPVVSVWNLAYFWIGRFTGAVWYFFPGAAILVFWWRRRDARGPDSGCLLAALALAIAVEIVLIPTNYHGGGGALGNRYFVPFYPAMLFLIRRPPRLWGRITVILLAGLFSGPFLLHPFASSYRPGEHARSGFYRYFPAEWTLAGSYPIFDPAYRRVRFPQSEGYYYFLDHDTWGAESGGFWIRGDAASEFLVETPVEMLRFVFQLEAPPAPVEGVIRCGSEHRSFNLMPDQNQLLEIKASRGHRLIDIFGRERWIYRFRVRVNGGIVPAFDQAGGDRRFLGVKLLPAMPVHRP